MILWGLDVWIETTPWAGGLHKRLCVTTYDENCNPIGKYCVSVQGKGRPGFQDDMRTDAIAITQYFKSDCDFDRRAKESLRNHVDNATWEYNVFGHNCRTWATNTFHHYYYASHPCDEGAEPPRGCEQLWKDRDGAVVPLPAGYPEKCIDLTGTWRDCGHIPNGIDPGGSIPVGLIQPHLRP